MLLANQNQVSFHIYMINIIIGMQFCIPIFLIHVSSIDRIRLLNFVY